MRIKERDVTGKEVESMRGKKRGKREMRGSGGWGVVEVGMDEKRCISIRKR